jgi:hypothetical protein
MSGALDNPKILQRLCWLAIALGLSISSLLIISVTSGCTKPDPPPVEEEFVVPESIGIYCIA